jgi:truncated hemoglobin YjbI
MVKQKIDKRKLMMKIYRWGFGNVLNAIFEEIEFIEDFGEDKTVIPLIKKLYKKVDKHYKSIDWIIQSNFNDPDIKNIKECKKRLIMLGELLDKYYNNMHNDKIIQKIYSTIHRIRDEGEDFRVVAMKYNVYSGLKSLRWDI